MHVNGKWTLACAYVFGPKPIPKIDYKSCARSKAGVRVIAKTYYYCYNRTKIYRSSLVTCQMRPELSNQRKVVNLPSKRTPGLFLYVFSAACTSSPLFYIHWARSSLAKTLVRTKASAKLGFPRCVCGVKNAQVVTQCRASLPNHL